MSYFKTPYRHKPRVAAILPTNSLPKATEFFSRLGFQISYPNEPSADDDYAILFHPNLAEVHLQKATTGWLVEGKNPFALYVYTEDVDKMAAEFKDELIEKPEHKPWKMYEFAINGPDDTLIRVGWPSEEVGEDELKKQEEQHT
jgi:hypothetical protein